MAAFDSALQEMDKILNFAHTVPNLGDDKDRARAIVDVRGRIVKQVAEMYSCLSTDPQFVGDDEVSAQFRDRLGSVRQQLAALQAKWRASEMIENFDGYAHESAPVAKACKDFVTWAQQTRRAA